MKTVTITRELSDEEAVALEAEREREGAASGEAVLGACVASKLDEVVSQYRQELINRAQPYLWILVQLPPEVQRRHIDALLESAREHGVPVQR